ncbi:MAG: phosphatase [Bacillota bacterium]|nr:phosphatase [Bacillota bacterium]
MKIVVDSHTHTISSGHAYSTVQEMAREAPLNGIEMIALTDHGPALHNIPPFHFTNMRVIPPVLYGTAIVKGIEANIIDYEGNLDLEDKYLKRLDFVIASLHDICIMPSTVEEHTNAIVNALKNPLVDTVGHPGNPQFQVDIEKVVKTAKEAGKAIEINNHSFVVRRGSEDNCREFVMKCKQYGVKVVCGSDAHISFDIGKFDKIKALFEECGMPEELILNTSVERFGQYLKLRKDRLK